jgi:tetratricopeptide (TPR) repeat protein
MRRKLAAFILLAGFAFAVPAVAEIGAGAPLPAEQSPNEKALVAKVQAAVDAKQWPDAEAALKQLVSSAPRWNYYEALGNAQLNQGHYADWIVAYRRATDLAQNNASTAAITRIYTMIGNANLKLKKNDAAIVAFTKATEIDPNPATAFFNLCAVMYNMVQPAAKTVPVCDKAIAADPKKAHAYFIKGSILFGEGTICKDSKTIAPPGTVEALKQYLVLAPNGGHAEDVKQMLDFLK